MTELPILGVDHARRFGGTSRLYGALQAQRIFNAHIMVVGIGGVGSWVAEGLARLGVGRLSLVDLDHVAESNINRQLHATDESLGQAKVQAMATRIGTYHPDCKVQLIDDWVSPENWHSLVDQAEHLDVVVDACDQWRAKEAMAAWALARRRSLVCVGAAGGKLKPQAVELGDLAQVSHDPLLAKLRYQLRRHHSGAREGAMGVTCVYSREAVRPSQDLACDAQDGSLNCHGYGSSATVTATFGMVAAAAAVDLALSRSV